MPAILHNLLLKASEYDAAAQMRIAFCAVSAYTFWHRCSQARAKVPATLAPGPEGLARRYKTHMHIPLVMTLIGRDRPGLVGILSDVVAAHGGNWLESRMCHLGGEFAGILRIHAPADKQDDLLRALRALEADGLSLVVRPDPVAESTLTPAVTATLELVGQDRPGIVRQVTGALARYAVNVEELRTECCSAPMSGETLFKAIIKLHIPADCPLDPLRQELERVAADLMVDVSFSTENATPE